jgi:hypothetical protein
MMAAAPVGKVNQPRNDLPFYYALSLLAFFSYLAQDRIKKYGMASLQKKHTLRCLSELFKGALLFFDMIPKAHKESKRSPTFGAVLGVVIGFAIVRVIGGGG